MGEGVREEMNVHFSSVHQNLLAQLCCIPRFFLCPQMMQSDTTCWNNCLCCETAPRGFIENILVTQSFEKGVLSTQT